MSNLSCMGHDNDSKATAPLSARNASAMASMLNVAIRDMTNTLDNLENTVEAMYSSLRNDEKG